MLLNVVRKKSEYSQGENPRSLENLSPRDPLYGTKKKRREISVTDEGWEGARTAIKQAGFSTLSDLVEKLGRGIAEVRLKDGE